MNRQATSNDLKFWSVSERENYLYFTQKPIKCTSSLLLRHIGKGQSTNVVITCGPTLLLFAYYIQIQQSFNI